MLFSSRTILIFLCFSVTSQVAFTQLEENTWFFGGGTQNTQPGIQFDFTTNEPSQYNEVRYPMGLQENNIIVSNPSNGDVQFYSNGQLVIDATHSPMPNGMDLNGSPSTMYGTSVMFDPSGCNRYFIVTVQSEDDAVPRRIYYSAIDLSMPGNGNINNPLGDVDNTVKNVDFTPAGVDCTESLFAIPKSGATKDSWLFFGDRIQRNLYLYEVTSAGITFFDQFDLSVLLPTLPTIELFSIKMDYFPLSESTGRLVIAPGRNTDQETYPIGSFIFNTETGSIDQGSYQLIEDETFWTYGTTFSPDGSKLYMSDYVRKSLNQFDYNTGNLTTIGISSHTGRSGGLETGPDGKVYWANAFVINGPAQPVSTLSIVNEPNLAGAACDLEFNSWTLGAAINPRTLGALPTFGTFATPPFALEISPDRCSLGIGSAVIDPAGSSPPLQYQWDNGETTALAENLTGGLHQVTITDGLGCETILDVFINDDGEDIITEIFGALTICDQGNVTTTLEGESGFDNYLWSNGEETSVITVDMPGVYSLTVSSGGSCIGNTSVEVTLESINVEIIGDTILCDAFTDSITLELSDTFDAYLWSDQSTGNNLTVAETGNYLVTVTNSQGCIANNSISINTITGPQITDLPSILEIDFGESITLYPEIDATPPYTIEWTPAEGLSCTDCPSPTIVDPLGNQTYQLLVTDESGCWDIANVAIQVNYYRNVYSPNVFSPDGDGVNDYFTLYGTSSLKEINLLQIYDRWGELIFEGNDFPANNENHGWSGKFNGQDVNPAVFTWIAELEFFDNSITLVTGDLLLVR